jgi:hypothetical protein
MDASLWFQLVLAIVSTCQLTETFRHSSLLRGLRAWVESRGPFWEELVGCGFCFSHWAAAIAVLLLSGHWIVSSAGLAFSPFLVIMLWLSAIRGANLLNDLTKQWSRSPSGDDIEIDPVTITEDPEDLSHDGITEQPTDREKTAGSGSD